MPPNTTHPPPQNIFITGATGYIGRVVTEFALAAGHSVRALSRSEAGDTLLRSLGATPVRGTLSDTTILAEEARRADVVFHLAFSHDWSKPYTDLLALDITAVDALASALQNTNKPLVTTGGTLCVLPDPSGRETDETAPPPPYTPLPRHLAEERALAWAPKGVRISVLRLPQYVYGRQTDHGFAADLIRLAVRDGEAVVIDDGGWCFSCVHVEDAARLYFLVARFAGPGDVFNGVSCTDVTYSALAGAIGRVVGVDVVSRTREDMEARWGRFLVEFVLVRNRASGRKARERLGWCPAGPGILEEVEVGSYVPVVERFKRERGVLVGNE
ncbi:hypothetical protein ANOM_011239 [Aspergillus nomiae NRRL 13137]|uniref:NAD-dependent epimerase/dehydratase domain-containing protein n=1 Tax=Aspergillus nomiae NRRL (strain ATCC 15546 / NRRL 13137 / CBS 260.88 / M93) TaxID=1509407 RepID=A0A0L1ILI3_ASPN3|nr:uncharacterized protein ANOM_011239 [Aspergillus nomiae NRRL 13137]KNG80387.1 hypothetical protein ANOM_011239 [Aspergillus nomiae NRRL 13137]